VVLPLVKGGIKVWLALKAELDDVLAEVGIVPGRVHLDLPLQA